MYNTATHTLLKTLLACALVLLVGTSLCAENVSGVFSEVLAPTESLLWVQKGLFGCVFAFLLSGQFFFPASFWLGTIGFQPAEPPPYPNAPSFPEPDTSLRDRFCRSNLSRAPPLA